MPPAFALSQDQTLRFISVPTPPPEGNATGTSTNRPELVDLFRSTRDRNSFKAYCNA
jgi:hypothetical protein